MAWFSVRVRRQGLITAAHRALGDARVDGKQPMGLAKRWLSLSLLLVASCGVNVAREEDVAVARRGPQWLARIARLPLLKQWMARDVSGATRARRRARQQFCMTHWRGVIELPRLLPAETCAAIVADVQKRVDDTFRNAVAKRVNDDTHAMDIY